MATPSDHAAMETYRNIVTEAFVRIHSIDAMLTSAPRLSPHLVREYCFLQLRMLCELISLGCLVCHGDIPAVRGKALQKAYKPTEIMAAMESLHPDFYPLPVTPIFNPGLIHLAEFEGDYLRKEELVALWQKSGDQLHKGSLRRFLKQNDTVPLRTDDIVKWNQKCLNLLENHRSIRVGGDLAFVVRVVHSVLTPTEATFNVSVAIAEARDLAAAEASKG